MCKKGQQLVWLKCGGQRVEVMARQGAVQRYRDNEVSWAEVLFLDVVYDNVRKGWRTGKQDLMRMFGTTDVQKCCQKIVLNGHIKMTTAERKAAQQAKCDEVVSTLKAEQHEGTYNENEIREMMRKAGVRVKFDSNEFKMLNRARDALNDVLQISRRYEFKRSKAQIHVPHEHVEGFLQSLKSSSGNRIFWTVLNENKETPWMSGRGLTVIEVEILSKFALEMLPEIARKHHAPHVWCTHHLLSYKL